LIEYYVVNGVLFRFLYYLKHHYYAPASSEGVSELCFCLSVRPPVRLSVAYIANYSRTQRPSVCDVWFFLPSVYTCLTACDRHQISSFVAVFALLTPRHCRCRRLVGLPLATAMWLQRGRGTVCRQRLNSTKRRVVFYC